MKTTLTAERVDLGAVVWSSVAVGMPVARHSYRDTSHWEALGGGWKIREGEQILSAENRNEMIERTSWDGLLDPEELGLPLEDKDRQDWRWPDW